MCHITDKYLDKLTDENKPEGREAADINSTAKGMSYRESYLLSLRDEFFMETVDYWILLLSNGSGLRFLDLWDMGHEGNLF